MAIYTPRGLKIRLAVPYAFGLMARLHPRVTAFRILKTTEGIEVMPGMLACVTGIITFVAKFSPLHIGLFVAGAYLLGVVINLFGIHFIPGLITLGTLYSYVAGLSLYAVQLFIGFVLAGWQGMLAFIIGILAAYVVAEVLDFWQGSRNYKLTGHAYTMSEVNFFNAYRLHASRFGVTTDVDVSDEEMEESHWGSTFVALAVEWPEIVQRFT